MDIKKEVKENLILLVLVPKESFKEHVLHIAKVMESLFNKTLFISISKPYSTLKKEFAENNISIQKFHIIDTLTSTVKEPPSVDNCTFVASPSDLMEIGVAFSEKMKNCQASMLDSISTALVYSDTKEVIKFAHTLITKARTMNKNIVFIALKEDNKTELIKEIYIFSNKVIESKL